MNPIKYRTALIAAAMLAGTSLAAADPALNQASGPASGLAAGAASGQPQRTGDSVDDTNDPSPVSNGVPR